MPAAFSSTQTGRVSEALAGAGVDVSAGRLAAAEPHAMRVLDEATIVGATDDRKRGWMYFNLILEQVGVELSDLGRIARWTYCASTTPSTTSGSRSSRTSFPPCASFRDRGLRWSWCPTPTAGCVTCSIGSTSRAGSTRCSTPTNGVSRSRILACSGWRSPSREPTRPSTAHVGDLYHVDVAGARRAGLAHAVLYDPASLYDGVDCPRIARLADLNAWLDATAARHERQPGAEPGALTRVRR